MLILVLIVGVQEVVSRAWVVSGRPVVLAML